MSKEKERGNRYEDDEKTHNYAVSNMFIGRLLFYAGFCGRRQDYVH